jgi:prepilin-type N-terminal cleavage/methylation domain-containing protein
VSRTGGYSIIELAVTMVVMGIVASIAIPGFSRWLPDYQLKTATTELYSNLQLAKMYAVRDNTEWALKFDTVFQAYQIRKAKGPDGKYIDDPVTGFDVEKTILLQNYKGGVGYGHGTATGDLGGGWDDEVTFSGGFDNTVLFSPRGMADSQGYVYLQNNKNVTYAVGTLTTGLILMRKWTGAAWE